MRLFLLNSIKWHFQDQFGRIENETFLNGSKLSVHSICCLPRQLLQEICLLTNISMPKSKEPSWKQQWHLVAPSKRPPCIPCHPQLSWHPGLCSSELPWPEHPGHNRAGAEEHTEFSLLCSSRICQAQRFILSLLYPGGPTHIFSGGAWDLHWSLIFTSGSPLSINLPPLWGPASLN